MQAVRHNDTDWSKQFVDDNNYETLYDQDVYVTKPDGSPLMVLLKNIIPMAVNAEAWSVLKKFSPKTENRAVATGIDAEPRRKLDGTMSNVTRVPRGWEVVSGIIGSFERTVRMPYAHQCAWNQQNPEKFARLFPLVNKVDELYRTHVPERHAAQALIASATPKDYLIGDSTFTTLTVNKNFRTACHKDAGDLPDGFSCMTIIREGTYKGAHLVLPNYRIAAKLDTGDLIMFDPHEYHGNTQIVPLSKNYLRCSIVYYYREMLKHCLPPAQELERAKNRKPGDPLF